MRPDILCYFPEIIGYRASLFSMLISLDTPECQRQWLYLEPIFSSEDINRQLPVESKRYQTMERIWRKVMNSAKGNPQVREITVLVKCLSVSIYKHPVRIAFVRKIIKTTQR